MIANACFCNSNIDCHPVVVPGADSIRRLSAIKARGGFDRVMGFGPKVAAKMCNSDSLPWRALIARRIQRHDLPLCRLLL